MTSLNESILFILLATAKKSFNQRPKRNTVKLTRTYVFSDVLQNYK